jgi:excisionase family DNA binding protein
MLSPADISTRYSVSRSTTYAACRSGMLAHYRVPSKKGVKGKYLIKESDLLAWLETLKSSGSASPPSAPAPASSRSVPVSPFSELDANRLAQAWKDH